MKILTSLFLVFTVGCIYGQTFLDSTINSSTKRIFFSDPNAFVFGSYGEAHYNQDMVNGSYQNGNMDLHRLIMFMGYKFNNKLQFFSEIEFEHVKEVYVEQAFLNYSFNSFFNVKGGIILIPVGYVNEFHEPTLFNGVERPNVDKYVIPTTWREMGLGLHGILKRANLKYQLYLVNGMMGYNGTAKINSGGIRSSRQKGAEASFSSPSLTGKLTYYGLNGLRLGVSGFFGNTVSTMYDGLDRMDAAAVTMADSSVLGIGMVCANLQYNIGDFQFTGIANVTSLSNTKEYNEFTGSNAAEQIMGYYGELAYKWSLKAGAEYPKLIPFVRYENYDTHFDVGRDITKDYGKNKRITTAGLGLQITPGTIVKIDYQYYEKGKEELVGSGEPGFIYDKSMVNVGFGYWF